MFCTLIRFSNDLDFSTTASIDPIQLNIELAKICDFVQDKTGVTFDKSRTRIEEKRNPDAERTIYEARLYSAGFYGKPHTITISVRLDFSQFDQIYLLIAQFKNNIAELSGQFHVDRYGAIAFFPSPLRNLILESASDLTLLELTYDNKTRIVEPYSLVFKRRSSDGFGQEYFYGFDRTGGRASGPGIKSFFHHKIQNIKKTNATFEPRFPVELSKAGEFAGRTYFGPTFGSTILRRTGLTSPFGAKIYIVECSY